MPHDARTSAAFLPDLKAQRLCLQDALQTRDDPAMLHALQAVAIARGIPRLASEIALTEAELARLLAGEGAPPQVPVAALIARLLATMPPPAVGPASTKTPKDRRAGGKTLRPGAG